MSRNWLIGIAVTICVVIFAVSIFGGNHLLPEDGPNSTSSELPFSFPGLVEAKWS